MLKSAALGIIFLVEFGLGLWQFKPHRPTSTHIVEEKKLIFDSEKMDPVGTIIYRKKNVKIS